MPSHRTPQVLPIASLTPHLRSAAVVAALLAAPAAWAGFSVSNVHPWLDDSNYPLFLSGPFDLSPDVPITGSGVQSQVRYFETRKTQLPTLDGTLSILDENADSGWHTTTVKGQVVNAIASIDMEPFAGFPTAARTTLFKNHVYAASEPKTSFSNSGPVTYGGTDYAPGSLFKTNGSYGTAESYWYDAWTADKNETATIELVVDGMLRKTSDACVGQVCGTIYPPGTDTAGPAAPTAAFGAGVVVYDMDHVMPCGGLGTQYWCGMPYAIPVAYIALAYSPEAGDPDTLSLDTVLEASFEAQVGRRYLAVGSMSASSANGTMVDFYNTASLRVQAPAGTLYSDGLGGADLGQHFAQAVPEPHTWALWAAGLVAVLGLRRRTARAA